MMIPFKGDVSSSFITHIRKTFPKSTTDRNVIHVIVCGLPVIQNPIEVGKQTGQKFKLLKADNGRSFVLRVDLKVFVTK